MNIGDFQNFMLLTEKGLGEDKILSFHNKPLDLQLYILVGFPFNCDDPNGIWTFIVSKNWVLENINRLINVSESNGNLYTLKNIKGTREKVPSVSNDLIRDIKRAYITNNSDGNERYIETTQFEFQSIMKRYIPALKNDLENRLKNRAIGADVDRNFADLMTVAKECIDIMQPWNTPAIEYAEQKSSKDACYDKMMKLISADSTLQKMHSMCNIFFNGAMSSPAVPIIGEAYDQAIQSVIKQGMELYDICIGVQPNQSSLVYQIKAITAKPKEFANWLKNEKYRNANVTLISCNKCNGSSVEVNNTSTASSGHKPNLSKEPQTPAASQVKVQQDQKTDNSKAADKTIDTVVNNPIMRFIGRTMTRQFWREFWRSVFR